MNKIEKKIDKIKDSKLKEKLTKELKSKQKDVKK